MTDKPTNLFEDIKAASGYRECSEEEAKINVDIFKEYSSARSPRYADMVENDNFYHGRHFTEAQEREIIAKGQAPLAINITYSIIKQMVSLLTSENPTWDVDPVEDVDKEFAYTMRHLLYGTWYNSRGGRQFSQIVKSTVVTGIGYASINPSSPYGQFGVQFKHVPYHHVYVSPNVREFSFEDAENIVLSKFVSLHQAAEIFGTTVKKVEEYAETATGEWEPSSEDDSFATRIRYMSPLEGHRRVRIIQRNTMEYVDAYIVRPNSGQKQSRRIYFTLPSSVLSQQKSGLVTVEKVNMRVLARYISLGQYCEKYYIPISTFNIVPFIDEFNDNPYPLGEVDFLMPIQKALNKFVLLAILNATLSNNMKVMSPAGAIDRNFYEENWAVPGVLIEYQWKDGMPVPKEINPAPMAGQFFELPKMLIQIMEYITGIFGVVQGNPEGAPRTASGLISLQNYGGQKVRLLGRNMNDALSFAGDVAIELWQNYAPYNGMLSYHDGKDMNVVKYNQLSVKNGSIRVDNDLSVGRYRARCIIRQNYGSERELKANLLANLAAQTKSTQLIKPILKLADIPEADEVLSQMDELANANQTIAQLQQSLERLQQINRQLENQLIQKSQKVEVAEFRSELERMMTKFEKELGAGIKDELSKLVNANNGNNGSSV